MVEMVLLAGQVSACERNERGRAVTIPYFIFISEVRDLILLGQAIEIRNDTHKWNLSSCKPILEKR